MSTKFGIVTVSDSCSAGEKPDLAGTGLIEIVKRRFADAQVYRRLVPDEKDDIIKVLQELTDTMDVVFTIGGTGFSQRDVTPEATRAVIEKEAPGLAYAMVSRSLQITEMAMLSRAVCGIRKKSLIVNLPGSAKASVECFGFIQEALPHAIALLTDNKYLVTKEHDTIQKKTNVQFTESKVKVGKVAGRDRQSPYSMVDVRDAEYIVFKETQATLCTDVVPFEQSIDRILADDIFASEPVPPFRASIKDGYAVKAADGEGERRVVEVASAGDAPGKVSIEDGEAVRISTGAPIPEGADAVVQVEDTVLVDCTADNMTELKIRIKTAPQLGQDIREVGSDVKVGELVLRRYDRITAAHVGVLAMLGITKVRIIRAPLIGVISTGNEVQHPYVELKPGQIRDSNKYTLLNFLNKYNYHPRDYGTARDNPNSIKRALENAFAENDFVITSGGVSMGEFDIIKKVLVEDFNAIIHFGRVNMKPGKPTTFATLLYNDKVKVFFGLPGNPVSCCVTCILFVIPALRHFERSSVTVFPSVNVYCCERNSDDRPDYRRVIVKFDNQQQSLTASSYGSQVSSKLNSMVGANGLTIVEKNQQQPKKILRRTILFDQLY